MRERTLFIAKYYFSLIDENQGLDIISDFVKDNKKVKESENYKFIVSYINMINNIKNNE